MRLAQAQTELKHRDQLASIETSLAVASALAEQRQAGIERLHSILTASAQQVPSMEAHLAAQASHLAEMKALQERLEGEGERARAEIEAWKARPWWRRLAG